MSNRPDCPGSAQQPLQTHNMHDGSWWPHGRKECTTCRGFYSIKRDGTLYRHKPHRGDDPYMAEKRQKLEAERTVTTEDNQDEPVNDPMPEDVFPPTTVCRNLT